MSTLPPPALDAPLLQPTTAGRTPVSRVSIADRVARSFPPLACVRGFRYFARKKVVLVSISDEMVTAEVKGTRMRHVHLHIRENRLAATCTCATKLLGPAACRHVWATLLEIDHRGVLEKLRATPRTLALGTVDEAPKARGERRSRALPAKRSNSSRTRARPVTSPA